MGIERPSRHQRPAVKADLRRIHCPDVPDLRSWKPPSGSFGILVQLMVGPAGTPGEESFDVTICTPGWIAERAHESRIYDLRHHVVIREFDYDLVERYFRGRVEACQGDSWDQIAECLGRIGRWEFEDYRPYRTN